MYAYASFHAMETLEVPSITGQETLPPTTAAT